MIKEQRMAFGSIKHCFVVEHDESDKELCCVCKEITPIGKAYVIGYPKEDTMYHYSGHKQCLPLSDEKKAQLFIDMQPK